MRQVFNARPAVIPRSRGYSDRGRGGRPYYYWMRITTFAAAIRHYVLAFSRPNDSFIYDNIEKFRVLFVFECQTRIVVILLFSLLFYFNSNSGEMK